MDSNLLHVVVVMSNPRRFKTRTKLFVNAVNHLQTFGVQLHVVECAFGERPFELTGLFPPTVDLIQVRTKHELWLKENLINVGVSRLPNDWKYVAWIDGDVQFVNPNWAVETVHMLQHHPIVQLFSHIVDVGPNFEAVANTTNDSTVMMDYGFAYQYSRNAREPGSEEYGFWHPGFAWACTKQAWDCMGGLIDRSIAGAADHQMAWALVGKPYMGTDGGMTQEFKDYITTWGENCSAIHHQMGYVSGIILHHWHGNRKLRQYRERWKMLVEAKFNPYKDVKVDGHGVLQFQKPNSKLMRDMQFYFQQRNEDSVDTE